MAQPDIQNFPCACLKKSLYLIAIIALGELSTTTAGGGGDVQ